MQVHYMTSNCNQGKQITYPFQIQYASSYSSYLLNTSWRTSTCKTSIFSVFQLNSLSLMGTLVVISKTNHYNELIFTSLSTYSDVLQNPGNSNSEGKRKTVRVSEVSGSIEKFNLPCRSYFLVKGKEFQFVLARNSNFPIWS